MVFVWRGSTLRRGPKGACDGVWVRAGSPGSLSGAIGPYMAVPDLAIDPTLIIDGDHPTACFPPFSRTFAVAA